ncbi:MAG: phospho-N-acetylmuramoyl-pentapeptide-transferase [Clostridia bacterium]|nr:phospho-N-acetylmuramoyl-pentapeptide-transferase [Clostridia bacterium]
MLDRFFPLYATVFVLSLVFTLLFEGRLLPILTKSASQPIYADGPRWHLSKSGTPTMGGAAFVVSISISLLTSALVLLLVNERGSVLPIVICQIYAILNSLVGLLDDLKKLRLRRNRGLSAKGKLILQFILAVGFLAASRLLLGTGTKISFSFGEIDLGPMYYPIALIILVGIVNCANLTDGIDGLASSVAFSIGVSLLYIATALSPEASAIASAIIGASVGFLVFNLHPAKIFMGDTGSLYFGALIAASGFVLGNPLLIIPIAGVYVLEGCSVILQVISYKLRKKRIFKMAPVHHHLEKCGWSENRICIVAIIMTFIFSIPAYVLFLP